MAPATFPRRPSVERFASTRRARRRRPSSGATRSRRLLFRNAQRVTKDDDGGRERRRISAVAEPEPAAQETNLAARSVVVPPGRIRSRGDETNDEVGRRLRRLPRLPHPRADAASVAAIGRVQPDTPGPLLREPVLVPSEVPGAFGVFVRRAGIKTERPELARELCERLGIGGPLVRPRRTHHLEAASQAPPALTKGRHPASVRAVTSRSPRRGPLQPATTVPASCHACTFGSCFRHWPARCVSSHATTASH